MDIRLNQALNSIKPAGEKYSGKAENRETEMGFEEILLETASNSGKAMEKTVITGAERIFEEMADTWFGYEDMKGSAADFFDEEYAFDDSELERLEDLVSGGGYYSVDSVASRLADMVKDATGGAFAAGSGEWLSAALKNVESSQGSLPEAVYDALDSAMYKLRQV
jgi:hypothetical protein